VSSPAIAVFAPNPLLTVTLELEGGEHQSIHFHAGGQGPREPALGGALRRAGSY